MEKYIDRSKKVLTEKQKRFCLEYLKDFNGTKAYQVVYKVNIKQAEANSSRLIRNDKVQQFLAIATQKQAEKAELSIEWVIKELKEIYRRCTEGRLEVHGATKSLEMLGKYLGMWIEKHDHADEDKLEIIHTYPKDKDIKKDRSQT